MLTLSIICFALGPLGGLPGNDADGIAVRQPLRLVPYLPRTYFRFARISPDRKIIAYRVSSNRQDWAPHEATIVLCDRATGKELGRLRGQENEQPSIAVFSPDASKLVVGAGPKRGLCLWDVPKRSELFTFERSLWPSRPVFSPDGKLLAASEGPGGTRELSLWDVETGKVLRRFNGKHGPGHPLCFSQDGRAVITLHSLRGEPEGTCTNARVPYAITVQAWEAQTGKHLGQVCPAKGRIDESMRVLPEIIKEPLEFGLEVGPCSLRFSTDGRAFAIPKPPATLVQMTFKDPSIRLSDVAGKELWHFEVNPKHSFVDWAEFFPQQRILVASVYWGDRKPSNELLVWDVSPVFEAAERLRPALSREVLGGHWSALADGRIPTAHRAMDALKSQPAKSLPFLKERLRPIPAHDPKRIAQLLGDLADPKFAAREAAERELLLRDEEAVPAIREALEGKLAPEARRCLDEIMKRLEDGRLPSEETRRLLWVVELLEQLATPEAKELLAALSQGEAKAWVTQEAKASLERLAKPDRNLVKP